MEEEKQEDSKNTWKQKNGACSCSAMSAAKRGTGTSKRLAPQRARAAATASGRPCPAAARYSPNVRFAGYSRRRKARAEGSHTKRSFRNSNEKAGSPAAAPLAAPRSRRTTPLAPVKACGTTLTSSASARPPARRKATAQRASTDQTVDRYASACATAAAASAAWSHPRGSAPSSASAARAAW